MPTNMQNTVYQNQKATKKKKIVTAVILLSSVSAAPKNKDLFCKQKTSFSLGKISATILYAGGIELRILWTPLSYGQWHMKGISSITTNQSDSLLYYPAAGIQSTWRVQNRTDAVTHRGFNPKSRLLSITKLAAVSKSPPLVTTESQG